MVFHYGPATWFITLSPGEWLWEDLGAYLRELNPEMSDSTISALFVAQPMGVIHLGPHPNGSKPWMDSHH